jgi:hypothetical protein
LFGKEKPCQQLSPDLLNHLPICLFDQLHLALPFSLPSCLPFILSLSLPIYLPTRLSPAPAQFHPELPAHSFAPIFGSQI